MKFYFFIISFFASVQASLAVNCDVAYVERTRCWEPCGSALLQCGNDYGYINGIDNLTSANVVITSATGEVKKVTLSISKAPKNMEGLSRKLREYLEKQNIKLKTGDMVVLAQVQFSSSPDLYETPEFKEKSTDQDCRYTEKAPSPFHTDLSQSCSTGYEGDICYGRAICKSKGGIGDVTCVAQGSSCPTAQVCANAENPCGKILWRKRGAKEPKADDPVPASVKPAK
ncbi:MAG: hypothetical protein JST80_12225 [Bdellovibrionales bacterium]|nr:hypothetical protein [Bdellovibrionales bacterium]